MATYTSEELMNFFNAEYVIDQEADELKKGLRADLKSWAENHEILPKSLNSAYNLYKKYKSGKNTAFECEEYSELSGVIESYFSTSDED